jgi:hypothetical protein
VSTAQQQELSELPEGPEGPEDLELPEGPVVGPDGIAVRFDVSKTAVVGGGPEPSGPVEDGGASLEALILVKLLRLIQVYVLRAGPWTLTVASAAPARKVVRRRYQSRDEAIRAALELVRSVETQGVAGF